MPSPRLRPVWLAALIFAPTVARAQEAAPGAPPPPPAAEAPAAPPAADARVDEVDQRTRVLERKLELLQEDAAKAKAEGAGVTAGERGFALRSADGAFVVKLSGTLQANGVEFLDDDTASLKDTFVVRKARPILEASFANVADFRVMPDFGGGTASLQDGYANLRPWQWLQLRAGKFKSPVGLERQQSDAYVVFIDRALPTAVAPNRDVGLMLHGLVGPGAVLWYQLAILDGAPDGGSVDLDSNHAKDFAGRVFLKPLAWDPYSLFANLGLGFGGSTGNQRGTAAAFQPVAGAAPRLLTASSSSLPTYRTIGQQTFLSFLQSDATPDATTIARGRRTRLSPQGYFYYGPFGLLGEWIQSKQHVERGADEGDVTVTSWQVAGYLVLGGKPGFEGPTITSPFDLKKGTFGALELAARYNELKIDDAAFGGDPAKPRFADPTKVARKAQAVGGVANWHWNRNIRLSLQFEHTWFEGGAKDGDRAPENVLLQMIQAAF